MLCARRSISMSTRLSRWALLTGLAFATLRPTIAEAQADVPDAADHHLKDVADSEYLRMISWLRRTCASFTQPATARLPAD
jgi:hypothetical protein